MFLLKYKAKQFFFLWIRDFDLTNEALEVFGELKMGGQIIRIVK